MEILAYRGKSLVSKLIQWQTRSPYSHVAIRLDDGYVVEAWHVGGVRVLRDPREGHRAGTPVDIYRVDAPAGFDPDAVKRFLLAQAGLGYDFMSVARFVSRREGRDNCGRWFCSELCLAAYSRGGLQLLHCLPSYASPRDIVMSPYLHYDGELA